MTVSVTQISSLTATQLERCHAILVDAFADHALVSSRAGFDHGVLSETIRAKLTEWPAAGRVWLAHKAETPDEVLGVALAIEPGGENAVAQMIQADTTAEVQRWQRDVFYAFLEDLDDKAYTEVEGHASTLFVNLLVVDAEGRGTGTGSALVRALCQRADERGWATSMYVTSSRLVEWYASFGFGAGASGELKMPSGKAAKVWALLRAAS